LGGTNAHVVVEEPPAVRPTEPPPRTAWPLLLSARTPTALTELADRYAAHLRQRPDIELADLCSSTNTGRTAFKHRLIAIATDGETLADELEQFVREGKSPGIETGVMGTSAPQIGWLFPGEGSQYAGIARSLWETCAEFRRKFEDCEHAARRAGIDDLCRRAFGSNGEGPDSAQPSTPAGLLAIELALAAYCQHLGIEPRVVGGWGVGSLAAGCVAGALHIEDAFAYLQALERDAVGVAAAVEIFGPPEMLAELLPGGGAASVLLRTQNRSVVCGSPDAIEALIERAARRDCRSRLSPNCAALGQHSGRLWPFIETALQTLEQAHSGTVRWVLPDGTVAGEPRMPQSASSQSGSSLLVDLPALIDGMLREGANCLIEVGPSQGFTSVHRLAAELPNVVSCALLQEATAEWPCLVKALGRLYLSGVGVDWDAFDDRPARRRVVLPAYPFRGDRFWPDFSSDDFYPAVIPARGPVTTAAGLPAKAAWLLGRPVRVSIGAESHHRAGGVAAFPNPWPENLVSESSVPGRPLPGNAAVALHPLLGDLVDEEWSLTLAEGEKSPN
ncbi:MAG: acyltransferase domain-containing protein, partial [Pirellulales bacterium]|nr:acyltransferase domain-containing protein [Pirellulales bacterium]